jgi:hypothetical protein
MATLARQFEAFHAKLALEPAREGRIQAALDELRSSLQADPGLAPLLREVLLTGSLACGTALEPADGTEFAADVVLALDLARSHAWSTTAGRNPAATLDWLAQRLGAIPTLARRVRRLERCVRLWYPGDFHLDLVPANAPLASSGAWQVPSFRLGAWSGLEPWSASHPKAYAGWCADRNATTNGRFSRIVRFLKCWRDHGLPVAARPGSMVLQTMIGQALPDTTDSDAHALTVVLRNVADRARSSQPFLSRLRVPNPVQLDEDLAAAWPDDSIQLFASHSTRSADRARLCWETPNQDRSAQLWSELFGERFPVPVS